MTVKNKQPYWIKTHYVFSGLLIKKYFVKNDSRHKSVNLHPLSMLSNEFEQKIDQSGWVKLIDA